MKNFLHWFKTKRFFLTGYFSLQVVIVSLMTLWFANYPLIAVAPLTREEIFLLIPLAFYLGIKIPTTMHNCFHRNLGRWSHLVGELTSLFVLLSYGIMCINHTFHHVHSDTELDPHNPEGKSFFYFFLTASFSGVGIIERAFLKRHGFSIGMRALFKLNIFLHWIGIPVRLAFWYFFLGHELFLFLYLPAFAVYFFSFAHVNYITHGTDESGKQTVFNMNSNLWYKLVNAIGDGVYFHKNHHANPGLYNPMKWRRRV